MSCDTAASYMLYVSTLSVCDIRPPIARLSMPAQLQSLHSGAWEPGNEAEAAAQCCSVDTAQVLTVFYIQLYTITSSLHLI